MFIIVVVGVSGIIVECMCMIVVWVLCVFIYIFINIVVINKVYWIIIFIWFMCVEVICRNVVVV